MSRSPLLSIAVLCILFVGGAPSHAQESLSPSMQSARWKHGSVPSAGEVLNGQVTLPVSLLEIPGKHNAEVHWYSPRGVVKDSDLDPTLTDAQGAQNSREVLAISMPRRPLTAPLSDSLWISVTYRLDVVGLDLSGRAIEFWVNDWRDQARVRGPGLRLHLDLGVVPEDQMRAPDLPPNRQLDTEDRPPHDRLLTSGEDTGTDGADDLATDGLSAPLDLVTASMTDLRGDNYRPPQGAFAEIDPRRWIWTNGTEGNGLGSPEPDSEDLDLDNRLDLHEAYFEYTIDLGDESHRYLIADVYQQFAGQAVPYPPGPGNGWRRYRIPLDDPARVQFGQPDLAFTQELRVWVDGIVAPDALDETTGQMRPLLMLAGTARTPDIKESIGTGAPNPFVNSTTFAYRLENSARVRSVVLDLQGREIAVLEDGHREPGFHAVMWDGRQADGQDAHPGVYFVKARFEGKGERVWRVVRVR